ncbi:MAG: hypothetical protein Q7R97_01295 [Candidatus Daviesbacteria bacterium]|nr:hypothetical protein [Candidatus Daviesbacteria bacterium]
MNLKGDFQKKLAIVIVFIVFACLNFFLGFYLKGQIDHKISRFNFTKEVSLKTQNTNSLTKVHSEVSPDGLKEIILYEKSFTGNTQEEYHNYLANQHIFAVREFDPWNENEIFLGDEMVGYPHWLGNDFIFFTTRCGTGCRGLELVNIHSKESKGAVITTTPISKDGYETNFRDWFGHEYQFSGSDKNLRSVYLNGKVYLIFEMWNNNQSIGEKKFLFTGNLLEE